MPTASLSAVTLRYYDRQGLSLQVARSPRLLASGEPYEDLGLRQTQAYGRHNPSGLCSTLLLWR